MSNNICQDGYHSNENTMLTGPKEKNIKNLHLIIKKQSQMNRQQKNEHFRQQSRQNYIQNIKKTVRFNWNVQATVQYLKSIEYKPVEGQGIIIEAIQNQNIEYLVELIVSADVQFKAAVVGQSKRLLQLIQSDLKRPSNLLLLGNLCALYLQFAQKSLKRMLLTKLIDQMVSMKSNLKCCQIYSWALTQMAREPHLLQSGEILKCCNQLYSVFIQAFSAKQCSSHLCTHLCRLVSQFSIVVQFSQQFLCFLLTIEPTRQVDIINTYVTIQNQIKNSKYSQNTALRIQIADYLLWIYPSISQYLFKSKKKNLYNLLSTLIRKSQQSLSQYLIIKKFNQILNQYQYSNPQYLKMFYQLLQRLDKINQQQILQNLKNSGLIQNIINDITDYNIDISYHCVKIIQIIIKQLLSYGQILYVQWILGLELQKQVQQFMQNIGNNQQMCKNAVYLLQMIHRQ